jgi:hypothetical protein
MFVKVGLTILVTIDWRQYTDVVNLESKKTKVKYLPNV